jgi:NAD+ diphosphatase
MHRNPPYRNPFSSASLDRRAAEREADDWLALALADPDTRFVVLRDLRPLVLREPDVHVHWLAADDGLVRERRPEHLVLLGWFGGRRCVLVEADERDAEPPGGRFEELRPLLTELPPDEAALLHSARALLYWRSRHRHCGVCGAPTRARSAGHALRCSNPDCAADFFPRIDPAVIVLVSDGTHVLLGRQASWPAGRYSALAGFVEAGESLEDAVAREVHEETGVRVHDSHYYASQPWPFPSSLMLGFHATATRGPVHLDGELEDARWYHADDLRRSLHDSGTSGGPAMLPPPHTIARRLIEEWLRRPDAATPAA